MARTQLTGENVLSDTLTGADISEETLLASKILFSHDELLANNIYDAIVEASIKHLSNIHCGHFNLAIDEESNVMENKIALNKEFFKLSGFMKHSGFISRKI